jgi:molybdenum cofactor cytidylyltransferase
LSHPDSFYVERYGHGGMSSGLVSPEFWRDTAVPLLLARHDALLRGGNA